MRAKLYFLRGNRFLKLKVRTYLGFIRKKLNKELSFLGQGVYLQM